MTVPAPEPATMPRLTDVTTQAPSFLRFKATTADICPDPAPIPPERPPVTAEVMIDFAVISQSVIKDFVKLPPTEVTALPTAETATVVTTFFAPVRAKFVAIALAPTPIPPVARLVAAPTVVSSTKLLTENFSLSLHACQIEFTVPETPVPNMTPPMTIAPRPPEATHKTPTPATPNAPEVRPVVVHAIPLFPIRS